MDEEKQRLVLAAAERYRVAHADLCEKGVTKYQDYEAWWKAYLADTNARIDLLVAIASDGIVQDGAQ